MLRILKWIAAVAVAAATAIVVTVAVAYETYRDADRD